MTLSNHNTPSSGLPETGAARQSRKALALYHRQRDELALAKRTALTIPASEWKKPGLVVRPVEFDPGAQRRADQEAKRLVKLAERTAALSGRGFEPGYIYMGLDPKTNRFQPYSFKRLHRMWLPTIDRIQWSTRHRV